MIQTEISLEDTQIKFLNRYKKYGFKDKSAVIREALNNLKRELELESLKKSADLYAELYEGEEEIRNLTESAISGWPE